MTPPTEPVPVTLGILSSVPLVPPMGKVVETWYVAAGKSGKPRHQDYGYLVARSPDALAVWDPYSRPLRVTVAYDPLPDIRPEPKPAKPPTHCQRIRAARRSR